MGISITALGPNSYQIDYTTNTTKAQLLAALRNVITDTDAKTHGWEVHDLNAGLNTVALRAPNKDGASYKYVVLDLATPSTVLLKVYETWDATAHTGTNLCNLSDNAQYGGKYTTTGPGQMFLFVSPRWLALTTRDVVSGQLNNNAGYQGAFGCFEFSRDSAEDTATAGYPPFLWTNTSALFLSSMGACGYSPRTRDASTGANAKIDMATILGKAVGTTTKMGALLPQAANVWNAKDWALTLYAHEPSFVVRGRIYGLKAFTMKKMLFMDKATVKVDSDYLYSATGTDTDHHVIVCNTTGTLLEGRVVIPV